MKIKLTELKRWQELKVMYKKQGLLGDTLREKIYSVLLMDRVVRIPLALMGLYIQQRNNKY
jgi:hypothetical protein